MWELQQMQGLPLELKIKKTVRRIEEYYQYHDGLVYAAVSGGLDSTALADIIKRTGLNIPLTFCNTGVENPKILKFALSLATVVVRPEHSYFWVSKNYGYPVISKAVSIAISRYRTAKDDVQRNLRLHGGINPSSGKMQKMGTIPKKYHYMIDAPFKISDKCCDILKKNPMKKYSKETGRSVITGELAADSNARKMRYLKTGCNFYGASHKSTPMGFWTDQDVLTYLSIFRVPYCREYYGNIEYNPKTDKLFTTKEKHSGCFGCMLGVNLEDPDDNRYTRMKVSDPLQYDICINKWGQGKILDFMGIKY